MDEELYNAERSKMGRSIPGQSLTNDPANPAPYEKAPEITNVHEGTEYLFDFITEETVYASLMTGISKGVPVMAIVQVILFNEFQKGKWNPDLMLMLAEPCAYILIALAERLDLDIIIDNDEEEGDVFGVDMEEKKLEQLRNSVIPQGFITEEMAGEMENLPTMGSLLEPQAEEAAPEAPAQPSLMAQPEGQ
tara:strand:+ start:2410 stop:2985 length:576 start_codon:yes stop_codon:yes gene_type:complete